MKKSITYIFIIFSFLGFIGCSDFLEEDNKGGIENTVYYSTVSGYKTLKTATYAQLRVLYRNIPILELAGTDLYLKGQGNNSIYANYTFESNAADVMTFYRNCYIGIQYANAGLYYIDLPPMTVADSTVTSAELRFLRAFYHFLLLEQFGAVVINTEYTNAVRLSIPRSTLPESYEFIISEMKAALPNLKTATLAAPGQVNQAVAKHYLSKVYLTRGWDLKDNADFTTAIAYADSVVAIKGVISQTFANVWNRAVENNPEFIFSVQYSSDKGAIGNPQTDGNSQYSLFATYSGGSSVATATSPAINRKRTNQGYLPVHAVYMNFDPNDNRFVSTFMNMLLNDYYNYYDPNTWASEQVRMYFPRLYTTNTAFTKTDSSNWKAQLSAMGLTPASNIFIFPITNNKTHYTNAVYAKGGNTNKDERLPVIRKFDDFQNAAGTYHSANASMRDVVLARLAETYFMKAEAQIALGLYDDAASTVQVVINRPGNKIDPAGADLPNRLVGKTDKTLALEAYLIEAGLEQFGEYNGRWQLLRRTGMLRFMVGKYNSDFTQATADAINVRYNLRPIPEDAIILNDALSEEDQNPGF